MDSYYFLHTRSLCNIDYCTYKAGLTVLNSLTLEMQEEEKRLKNEAVYKNPLYVQLFDDYAETAAIIQFIEQCASIDTDIVNDAMFQTKYPNKSAGFWGVSFVGISGIASNRMVVDSASLKECRKCFLDNCIKHGNDKDLPVILLNRFPAFSFTKEAQDDLLWWKHNAKGLLGTVIDLLDDIPFHPFTGGLGKTEVLKNRTPSTSSKRITHEDRLTYSYGTITSIQRCKEHYK